MEIRLQSRTGFTLIELSIVLVIIGLLVGGVLVGRDLIIAAELRADIKEGEKLNTAVATFLGKYNCLPGDCANATTFFGTTDAAGNAIPNGDGNGMIRGYLGPGASETVIDYSSGYEGIGSPFWPAEWFEVFEHLSLAGLTNLAPYDVTNAANNTAGIAYPIMHWQHGSYIPGFIGPPYRASPGGILVAHEVNAHYIRYGVCYVDAPGWGNTTLGFMCGYTGEAAASFDAKIDDGLPYSGAVQTTESLSVLRTTTTTPAGNLAQCVDSTANAYTIQSSYRACGLRVKAAF